LGTTDPARGFYCVPPESSAMTGIHRIWSVCALALSLFALPLTTSPAAADPIPIVTVTSGSAILDPFGLHSRFDLRGTQGFSFVGESDDNSGVSCSVCAEGEVHDFSVLASGSYRAAATLRGQAFVFDFDNGGGQLFFETPEMTFPPQSGSSGTTQFILPFALGFDSFLSFQPQPRESNPTFSVGLRGSGRLTVLTEFINLPEFGTVYTTRDLRFAFKPGQQPPATPEPASLLLLGTGVAIACYRTRKG
jgi:hypothetical protein